MLKIDELLNKYICAAVEYGQAMKNHNSAIANQKYDTINKIYKDLMNLGQEGKQALINLMDHQEPYVRLSAGTQSLNFAEDKAKKVLMELKAEGRPIGFDAGMVLKEWKKGNLRD